MASKKIIDFKTLFLGSKSENFDLYKNIVNDTFNDVAYWRKNYHAKDNDIITAESTQTRSYVYTQEKLKDVMSSLSARLRGGSIPWHSPRYLGHMNSETLMPGIIAYFETMFYNGNNVAYESSPATSKMEDEVGLDFCQLLGFDLKKGWGHICADGSLANYEGLWYARNFKSLPFAMKKAYPTLVGKKTPWELSNMSVDEILTIMDKNVDKWDAIKNQSVRSDASGVDKLGIVFVPRTKHYSWLKAADILGIGTNNVVSVDVDNNYRMDIKVLEREVLKCIKTKTPILAVVAVVGTTEEGMIDHVDQVVALRKKIMKSHNAWFYFHVDAAYGGYARSICIDENNKFMDFKTLEAKYREFQVFQNLKNWPTKDTHAAFQAMGNAESITIDPHKMGYAPYAAGGIAIRNIKMRNVISYFATYVFDTKVAIPDLLGAYMIEGSKAGATAAAVWTNHQVVPLNVSGYGRLMGHSIEGAFNLYNHLETKKTYVVNKKKINVFTLIKPDFNMVDFIFNYEGNTSLDVMNELNQAIYTETSFVEGDTYLNNLILSHTSFSNEDYGLAPTNVLTKAGIKTNFKNQTVTILRSCVLSPWLYDKKVATTFFADFDQAITEKLTHIVK